MAKQIVNIGTTANDKSGDNLRAAFNKVNLNFTELYTALGINADTTLNLGAFEFNGSVMSTTNSTPIVIDQATTVTSNLTVGNTIQINRSILSSTNLDVPAGVAAVIYSTDSQSTSIKLIITVESRLDSDLTLTNHTQTCEATISAQYNSNIEPVISAYGIIYTSPTPLATFTVRRGIGNIIEIVAQNNQSLEIMHVNVHAVKFVSYYN